MAAIAGIGYQGVEIMADKPHFWPPDLDEEKVGKVRDKVSPTANTAWVSMNTPPALTSRRKSS
jgi:hypothetical protein